MSVSVIIPALNEESTVAGVIRACLADDPLEVLVIDADSTDYTAAVARAAGADVRNWRDILPEPPRPGKGESLWRGVAAARGDIVVFIDADLESAAPGMVTALAAPFADPGVNMVKARYRRSLNGQPTGGGRVTELTAKPLIRQFFPELAHIDQPLGGEYALRRSAALEVPFVEGYGVEAGLLVDIGKRGGLTQVDLGTRVHRNRPLHELAPMADIVARTLLSRAGVGAPIAQRPPLLGRI